MTKTRRTVTIATAAALFVGFCGYIFFDWWATWRFIETTDNAFVKADISPISTRVTGYITDVLVEDNQIVTVGDVLARINPVEFEARLKQGQAEFTRYTAALSSIETKIELQRSLIDEAAAELEGALAEYNRAIQQLERAQGLLAENVTSRQRYDLDVSKERSAKARVTASEARLKATNQEKNILEIEREKAKAELAERSASIQLLQIDLQDTVVRAPVSGMVGNRGVRVGQLVRPGTPLMSVVPVSDVWIVANYKETQLTHLTPGLSAHIEVDAFPDVLLVGKVDSLAPASGAEFSLLPPENASGNFSKVVQRVPVKIVVTADHPLRGLLRPGMSAIVSIDTSAVAKGALAAGSK